MNKVFFQLVLFVFFLFIIPNHYLIGQKVTDSLVLPTTLVKIKKEKKIAVSELSALIETDTLHSKIEKEVTDSINKLMEEYWANNAFNPYSNTFLKYPFNVTFTDTVFTSPIERKKVITSRYGWRWGRPHHGIDIDLISGDPVKAILDGKVRFVRYHGGHGKTVIIRHKNGLETVYAHLSKQLVKENDTVIKGQVIGKGGVTGNARGSHLHLEVRYQGQSINPEYLFDFNEDNTIRSKELWVTKKWTNPLKHRSTRKSRVTVYTSQEDAIAGKEAAPAVYIIRKGDTLWSIAKTHQLSVNQLCKLNAIKKTSKLKIGQRIVLN